MTKILDGDNAKGALVGCTKCEYLTPIDHKVVLTPRCKPMETR